MTYWKCKNCGEDCCVRERIAELEEENTRLTRIIAKELTENGELGSEFVYVQALKERLKAAEQLAKAASKHLVMACSCPYATEEGDIDNYCSACKPLALAIEAWERSK